MTTECDRCPACSRMTYRISALNVHCHYMADRWWQLPNLQWHDLPYFITECQPQWLHWPMVAATEPAVARPALFYYYMPASMTDWPMVAATEPAVARPSLFYYYMPASMTDWPMVAASGNWSSSLSTLRTYTAVRCRLPFADTSALDCKYTINI